MNTSDTMNYTKVFIADCRVGQTIATVFLLRKKELLKTKDNKPYLKLEFADKTGVLEGRMWERAEEADRTVDTGAAVTIQGTVEAWKGTTQIKVNHIELAHPQDYQHSDLIRSVENIDDLFERTKALLRKNIEQHWLSRLSQEFLDDTTLMTAFKNAPGARSWHNAYVGGLLEHTYEVMVIVEKVCELYPEAQRDLAMFGAFLHDMGKVYELEPFTFEYTLHGGLVGHITLGFELLTHKINALADFPSDVALQLKHIILSHHGEYEQQSPVLPKTLEAIIVYHADELVSQANAVKEIMKTQTYGDREWSNFISIKNRKFLLKRLEDNHPSFRNQINERNRSL